MIFNLITLALPFLFYITMFTQSDSDTQRDKVEKYRILYIFPHPDDESYGPAAAIDNNVKAGHEVHLLTLTKGGATSVRHELNLSIEQMNQVRYKEMLNVEKTLHLSSMSVLDFPDGGLKELDILDIEKAIEDHILKIKPNIVVTYPVHGTSTHSDHIVCHAAVKHVFLALKKNNENLMRLAFFGLTEEDNEAIPVRDFMTIKEDETDCVVSFSPDNVGAAHKSLDCYVTYKPMIENSNIKAAFTKSLSFEFYMETFNPPVASLTENLVENGY